MISARGVARAAVVAGMVIAACAAVAWGDEYLTINFPGSTWTQAYSIDGTNIVGQYGTPIEGTYTSLRAGFLYDGATYQTIMYPGASMAEATGISGGRIVGYYGTSGDATPFHGFLYDGTSWASLDYPGARYTVAWGIDGNNIVGNYTDSSGTQHGFVYDGSSYRTLDTAAYSTRLTGISGNRILAIGGGGAGEGSFLYDGTSWTSLAYPGAVKTYAQGIWGSSIVGWYYDGTSDSHGFLFDGTNWTTLDFPTVYGVQAYGISGQRIVGAYQDGISYSSQGFLYGDLSGFPPPAPPVIPEPASMLSGLLGLGMLAAYLRPAKKLFQNRR
jgi:hypothetical protein